MPAIDIHKNLNRKIVYGSSAVCISFARILLSCTAILVLIPSLSTAQELVPAIPSSPNSNVVNAANNQMQERTPNSGRKTKTETNLRDVLRRKGDLTLRNATLSGALFTISELWDVNLVVGKEVEGQVNGVFKKATLNEILDALLLSNGYSYRPVGNSLVIMKMEALGSINPLFESATIIVKRGKATEILSSAMLMKSPQGQLQVVDSANALVVLDFPDRVKMIRKFVAKIDSLSVGSLHTADGKGANLSVTHYKTKYISADDAKIAVETLLSKEGKVSSITSERRLIVVDYPAIIAKVQTLLQQIDQPRPQVRIHALIYDVSLQDMEQLGFNWNHAVKGRQDANGDPRTLFSVDSIMQVPFAAGTPGAGLTFANLSENFDITVIAKALQTANDARLIADPNVSVQDNHEAMFDSITEIPYQELTQTGQGGQIGTTNFREVGIKLLVKPTVSPDGTITMLVSPEFSRLTGFTPQDNQPIIDTRRASTTVRIGNRQTLVIGGLRQRSDTGNFNGVTGLKNIKYLGNLFRSRDTDVRESELLVFIMPEIINFNDQPKPRQMAAAAANLYQLNQIPVAKAIPQAMCLNESQPCENAIPMRPNYVAPSVLPIEAPQFLKSSRSTSNNPFHGTQIRKGQNFKIVRLPSIRKPSQSVPFSATTSSSMFSAPTIENQKGRNTLRKPYAERFRATGDIYTEAQRKQKPAGAPTSRQKTSLQKKSWAKKFFGL